MNDSANIMDKFNKVTADLVATYDLSAADAKSVTQIDYLCVYEYKYNGKTYKYRMRKRDNFDPIPEELELYFDKNPEDVFRKSTTRLSPDRSKKGLRAAIVIGIIFLAIFIGFIAMMIKEKLYGAVPVLLIVVICSVVKSRSDAVPGAKKKNDIKLEEIEEALLDSRSVTAYLVKYRSMHYSRSFRKQYRTYAKSRRYKAKYVYRYNGRDYKKTFYYDTLPPKSMRFFIRKNPKDVFFI